MLGYLIRHPGGLVLLDTGMGAHPDVDAHYRPHRIGLAAALAAAGSAVDEVTTVVNCHLHFDHCGSNPDLAGRPILVQAEELAEARGADYTLLGLVDFPGAAYEEITGDAEIGRGVHVVPTPGHTRGHQSVVVRRTDGTVVVLAGQSHDTASDFSADALAVRAAADGHGPPLPVPPGWVERLLAMDPRRVYFAHDHAIWTPG